MKKRIYPGIILLAFMLLLISSCNITVTGGNPTASPANNGAALNTETPDSGVSASVPAVLVSDNANTAPAESPASHTPESAVPTEAVPESQESGGVQNSWTYEFDTVTLDGDAVSEEDFYGRTLVVLNIWATWCPPCVEELPALQEISEYYADKNVEVVGVLQDGVTYSGEIDDYIIETAKALIEDAGVTYKMILPDDMINYMFIEDMQFFPTTYIIGAEGRVLKIVVGAGDVSDWKGTIDEVLSSITQ